MRIAESFPRYELYAPQVPVRRVSRDGVAAIHRFYDTSPISPSGRYIVFNEFDFEDRLPEPGDSSSVVVVDLVTGDEVYRTRTMAWDTQVGSHAQWGREDSQLFFNRMPPSSWRPHGVMVDPLAGVERQLDGPVYMVSPDGATILSPDLVRIWLIQPGYGVVVPPESRVPSMGAPSSDGLFVTDVQSGTSRLALSFAQIYDAFPAEFADLDLERGGFYGFHVKWSPDGNRIMFLVRWGGEGAARKHVSRNWIITMDSEFGDLNIALGPERWAGGHHPNWCPDGERIIMNLVFPTRRFRMPNLARLMDRVVRKLRFPLHRSAFPLRFATFRYNGDDLRPVSSAHLGSGHPTWHESLAAVLTDAYPWEPVTHRDGTSPIRLLSTRTDEIAELVRIRTAPAFMGPRREWRVDPHPAWNRAADRFVFNGCPDGVRGVYVADMSEFLNREADGPRP